MMKKAPGRPWRSAVISSKSFCYIEYTCTAVTCIGVGQGLSHLYLYVATHYFSDVSNIIIRAGEKYLKEVKEGSIAGPHFQSGNACALSAKLIYSDDYNDFIAIQHQSPITYRVINITIYLMLLFIKIGVLEHWREYHTF